eukprot:10320120-Karenia_brevis.AAC.1
MLCMMSGLRKLVVTLKATLTVHIKATRANGLSIHPGCLASILIKVVLSVTHGQRLFPHRAGRLKNLINNL